MSAIQRLRAVDDCRDDATSTATCDFAHLEARSLVGERWAQRLLSAVLVTFLLLGLFNQLGMRLARVSAPAGDATLSAEYPAVTRAGLHSPLAIIVRRPGGFAAPISLTLDRAYLQLFDEATTPSPPPIATEASEATITWTFQAPQGDALRVDLDARVAPDASAGRAGFVALGDAGRELGRVDWRTRILP